MTTSDITFSFDYRDDLAKGDELRREFLTECAITTGYSDVKTLDLNALEDHLRLDAIAYQELVFKWLDRELSNGVTVTAPVICLDLDGSLFCTVLEGPSQDAIETETKRILV